MEEPDEVGWAASAGCMMAGGMSWILAGSVRIEVGCMLIMETAVSLVHEICLTAPILDHDRSPCRVAKGGGAATTRVFGSGRTLKREVS